MLGAPNIQHDWVTDIFTNLGQELIAVHFNYVKKGEICTKYSWPAIHIGDHILKCKELNVGFHSIKDMQAYVYGLDNGLVIEEI